jgi:RimJ/RimL family protein N-acetyltransferase
VTDLDRSAREIELPRPRGMEVRETCNAQINEFGQLVGLASVVRQSSALAVNSAMLGQWCRVEPFDADSHLNELFKAFSADDGRMWTYLAWGPFPTASMLMMMLAWTGSTAIDTPLQWYAIVDTASGTASGLVAYLRHDHEHGVIEIGGVTFSPELRRTRAATEALCLMARRAFEELGCRRCEWRADALNAASRIAALRLGFQFEGVFRQASIYKGRNRDSAWYSIIDTEWPGLADVYACWLAPENFDASGHQHMALSALTVSSGRSRPQSPRTEV